MQENKSCDISDNFNSCNFERYLYFTNPECLFYESQHIKTPEKLRAVYYSAFGASSEKKISYLINLSKTTEINSVVLDIKEINGETYFTLPENGFVNIKPHYNKVIKNPKKLIEKLHKNGIYVIGRIVLFKDKFLAGSRPDLAVKKSDKKTVWVDYNGKKWVDSGSKEVWDYNMEIAAQAYLMGFDEINLDYVRFPSDGPMKDIYFPFSNIILEKNKKWGKTKIMDNFYKYFTEEMRKKFPKIILSANMFGQVTITNDDSGIGQILESPLLYFDYISPMAYPSHYHKNYLSFVDGPDNHPYEVINDNLKRTDVKLKILNDKINFSKTNNTKIKLREGFYSDINIKNLKIIKKDKIRMWLQAFTCTWCKNSKEYNSLEIRKQIDAIYDNAGKSWMLWNASSKYSRDIFK